MSRSRTECIGSQTVLTLWLWCMCVCVHWLVPSAVSGSGKSNILQIPSKIDITIHVRTCMYIHVFRIYNVWVTSLLSTNIVLVNYSALPLILPIEGEKIAYSRKMLDFRSSGHTFWFTDVFSPAAADVQDLGGGQTWISTSGNPGPPLWIHLWAVL